MPNSTKLSFVATLIAVLMIFSGIGCDAPYSEVESDSPSTSTPTAKVRGEGEPDFITVQHILIGFKGSVDGKPITRSKEEAKKLAEELFEKAKTAEDFGALVSEFTDDAAPGIYQMANFGEEADMSPPAVENKIFPRGGMVGAFGNTGFPLAVGEVGLAVHDKSNSPYGWHIVKRIK